jgi:hypothetical protein
MQEASDSLEPNVHAFAKAAGQDVDDTNDSSTQAPRTPRPLTMGDLAQRSSAELDAAGSASEGGSCSRISELSLRPTPRPQSGRKGCGQGSSVKDDGGCVVHRFPRRVASP